MGNLHLFPDIYLSDIKEVFRWKGKYIFSGSVILEGLFPNEINPGLKKDADQVLLASVFWVSGYKKILDNVLIIVKFIKHLETFKPIRPFGNLKHP